MPKNVTIYSSPTCTWCQREKAFFKENKVKYKEVDVSKPANAKKMVKISGQTGTPVTVIGKEVIVGFDEAKLKKVLKLK